MTSTAGDLKMALKMIYVANDGTEHLNSYWRPVQINIGIGDKTANVVFYGYKDQAARHAGNASIGSKSYAVSGDQFEEYFSSAALLNNDPAAKSYELAINVLDTGNTDDRKSFFHDSEDV